MGARHERKEREITAGRLSSDLPIQTQNLWRAGGRSVPMVNDFQSLLQDSILIPILDPRAYRELFVQVSGV